MTQDDQATTTPDPTTPQVQEVLEVGTDPMLETLAMLAHRGGLEMSLTLTVPGAVVTGILIGRNRWLDMQAELARNASESGGLMFDMLRDVYRLPEDDDAEAPRWGFLHLRNAGLLQIAGASPRGQLWRVRISEVSGWMLGELGSQ